MSRLNDELLLLHEIKSAERGFNNHIQLYPNLELNVHPDGWIDAQYFLHGQEKPIYFGGRSRQVIQTILRKWW